ncbi:hypothetical protein FB45DRAFT_188004 [Roridomyces roridus]|uniref:Uncharacterized protein n=1 Tax=Roridomyces roridus TaxID=1738132 RepID=A0AAD7FWL1_9AGAR|nr:hypothetical protein FB45DRAFT_188004 [Roridomyces roridus]
MHHKEKVTTLYLPCINICAFATLSPDPGKTVWTFLESPTRLPLNPLIFQLNTSLLPWSIQGYWSQNPGPSSGKSLREVADLGWSTPQLLSAISSLIGHSCRILSERMFGKRKRRGGSLGRNSRQIWTGFSGYCWATADLEEVCKFMRPSTQVSLHCHLDCFTINQSFAQSHG